MNDSPRLFRVTLEVADLEAATQVYINLFGQDGRRHPGARHYFDCGDVIVAVLDVSQGGMSPTPGPNAQSLAWSVSNSEPAILMATHWERASLRWV